MRTIKQQALEVLGKYMDKASKPKRKALLYFLEGFVYHSEAVESMKQQKDKSA